MRGVRVTRAVLGKLEQRKAHPDLQDMGNNPSVLASAAQLLLKKELRGKTEPI